MADETTKKAGDPKPAEVTRVDGARPTVPSPDAKEAAKGTSFPAPIPEDKLPNKEKELKKAQAMLDGRDPEFVEMLDEAKDGKKMLTVRKDGETLRVHPSTLEAHLAAGWAFVDEDEKSKAKDAK